MTALKINEGHKIIANELSALYTVMQCSFLMPISAIVTGAYTVGALVIYYPKKIWISFVSCTTIGQY